MKLFISFILFLFTYVNPFVEGAVVGENNLEKKWRPKLAAARRKKLPRLNFSSGSFGQKLPETRSPNMEGLFLKLKAAVDAAAMADTREEAAQLLVRAISEAGIKAIAADFDKTMITLHSGGATSKEPSNFLLKALSPDFNLFATEARKKGLPISVVTFSDPQMARGRPTMVAADDLVRLVLKESRSTFTVDNVYAFYPPLYAQPKDFKSIGLKEPMPNDKSYHINLLCKDMGIKPSEVLLIDDDTNNCARFSQSGGLALNVIGNNGFSFGFLKMVI